MQRSVRSQELHLVRVAQQQAQAVADQVGGGLEPGGVQQDRVGDELLDAEPVALGLDLDQGAQEPVVGMGALLLDELEEVHGQLIAAARPRRSSPRRTRRRSTRSPSADQRPDVLVALARHAEQLADDRHRERHGELPSRRRPCSAKRSSTGSSNAANRRAELLDPRG
jgi:hypothetical protein